MQKTPKESLNPSQITGGFESAADAQRVFKNVIESFARQGLGYERAWTAALLNPAGRTAYEAFYRLSGKEPAQDRYY